jgi:hypothetical protein
LFAGDSNLSTKGGFSDFWSTFILTFDGGNNSKEKGESITVCNGSEVQSYIGDRIGLDKKTIGP